MLTTQTHSQRLTWKIRKNVGTDKTDQVQFKLKLKLKLKLV